MAGISEMITMTNTWAFFEPYGDRASAMRLLEMVTRRRYNLISKP